MSDEYNNHAGEHSSAGTDPLVAPAETDLPFDGGGGIEENGVPPDSGDTSASAKTDVRPVPRIWDYAYWVLFQPAKGFDLIAERRPLLSAAAVFLLVRLFQISLNWSWFQAGISSQMMGSFDLGSIGGAFILMLVLFSLVMLLLNAAVINFVAELLGGEGSGVPLLAGVGFASLPGIFSGIFTFLSRRFAWGAAGDLLVALVFAWSVALWIMAVRSSHRLSYARAAMAVLLPYAVGILVLIAAVALMLISMSSLLSDPSFPFPGAGY